MYEHDAPRAKVSKPTKLFLIVTATAFLALATGAVWLLLVRDTGENADNQATSSAEQVAEAAVPTGTVNGRFMFSGTVVTARAVENEARDANGNVNWASVFSEFDSFGPEKYAEWFIDMECPVTNNFIPYRTQVNNTVFNCPPSVFPEMNKYITVANIANNHTRDAGDEGFTETRGHILESGLQAVGHWDPREKDDLCEVMSLTYSLVLDGGQTSDVELPIAVCAFHYFEKEPLEDELAMVSQYADIMPVIGLMQVGVEYRASADDRQVTVGRALIDQGADFVVGNSPHWVQNTEVYNGKLIVYSTGNFIFDQLDEETNRGLNLDVSSSVAYSDNLAGWINLARTCGPGEFKDDCLSLAREAGLQKIDFAYTYDIVASTGGFREITQAADADTQAAVEERANWAETLAALETATQ